MLQRSLRYVHGFSAAAVLLAGATQARPAAAQPPFPVCFVAIQFTSYTVPASGGDLQNQGPRGTAVLRRLEGRRLAPGDFDGDGLVGFFNPADNFWYLVTQLGRSTSYISSSWRL